MGVAGAGDVMYKVSGLKLEHLANACLLRAQHNSRSSICAVIDASWIGMKATAMPPVLFTLAVLEALVSAGFTCHVIIGHGLQVPAATAILQIFRSYMKL